MASNSNLRQTTGALDQELNELRKRVEWLDEERRKAQRKLAEVEQRTLLQDREAAAREQRIQDLERQLANVSAQLTRIPQVDAQLVQFKDDMVKMIEQYDRRRIEAEKELDRLRRVEHESTTREIADLKKELLPIPRMEQDLKLRQAEDARLANLIGVQQNALTPLRAQVEAAERSVAFFEEREKQTSRGLAEVQAALLEINKKWEPIQSRLDILSDSVAKTQTGIQAATEAQTKLRDSIKDWSEQVQIGEHERNQRLANWQRAMDEHDASLQRFVQEWVKFNNQYNESRTAVEQLRALQGHLEQQQREASELIRVESKRMESRWEQFIQEDNKKWRNVEADRQQRQQILDRRDRQFQEQLQALQEALEKLQQDREQLWRVHSAQAEAIKKWPLLWLNEIEKAMEQNPNRRRQPTTTPIQEE